jgi:hypothetical protein
MPESLIPTDMCEKILNVNFSTQSYNGNKHITVVRSCNGFTVKNRGNSILVINQDPLDPGESKAFGLNRGEVYTGRIDISFRAQAVQPVPRVDAAFVTQKFYLFKEEENNKLR